MKRVLLAVSISALMLSMGGAAFAAPVTPTSSEITSDFSSENARMSIIYVPAGGFTTMDQNVTLVGLGQKYPMASGSNWLIWSGSDVIKLDGNKIISIGYGSAQVGAYKGDGTLLGWYYVTVIR